MEELNLIELLRYYLKKLPIILFVVVLTLIGGYMYIKNFQTPLYHGSTTIILVQKQGDSFNSSLTQNELTVNEKLVSTYSEIIKSRKVLEQVLKNLDLDITTSQLAKQISVNSIKDTSIIKITVTNEDNVLAVKIANKLALVFKEVVSEYYDLENISVIDEAIVESEPYNINTTKQLVIYTLVTFVLSCAVIFVIYYFDNKVKTKKEIETKLNLPVLAEVPIFKK